MEDVTIESLIAQRRVVTTADLIAPANDYMVVGVYQKGTNPMKGDGTSYKNYVISIAELLGGGSVYTASNGITLVGNDFQLTSNNISQFTNDSGYLTATTVANVAWKLDGNTVGSEKFLGTIDNFAVPVYTNGTQVARFTETGEFIIGSAVTASGQLAYFERNQNNFTNALVSNTNTHVDASAAFVVQSDTVTAFFGAGSSIHSSFPDTATFGAVTSNLYIAAGIAGLAKDVIFFNGGLSPTDEKMRIKASGDVGIGIISPTVRLHVKGATSYAGTPIFRVENLADTAYANITDDGNIYISSNQYTGVQWQVNGAMVTQIITTGADIAKQRLPTDYTFTRKADDFILGGKSGVNWFFQAANNTAITPSAKVHIQAEGNTSAEYGLKVLSLAGTSLLTVRGDGYINTSIPTSGTGLPPGGTVSGDLWHDTLDNTVKRVP